VPALGSPMRSSAVMIAHSPPPSTNRHAASTFGPIEPLAKWPAAAYPRSSATVTAPSGVACGVPQPTTAAGTSVAISRIRGAAPHGAARGGAGVLVAPRRPAARCPARLAPRRPPAAAVGHHHEPGGQQGHHGRRVEHLERLRGGHHPAPAALAAVLPELAVVH